MKSTVALIFVAVMNWCALIPTAHAQMITTEEKFQDLFVTAGYATAFGAAFGAALLSFQAKPEQNLRFIAIGASAGFICGSLMGSYIVFSPVFVGGSDKDRQQNPLQASNRTGLRIVPGFDTDNGYKLSRLEGQWTFLRF
ncbi:MAG: hypothetical protein NTX25_11150 [Proteobacteria bacterium]|nr:hypothetical protein [Pseudomonadota bacterium]